jgi:hypothetical protein
MALEPQDTRAISPWKSSPDFFKEQMFAMSLLPAVSDPAPTAAVNGYPQAEDD